MQFAIDRGGTFTDIYAIDEGRIYVEKLLSVDPEQYEDAPREGIRRLLERVKGRGGTPVDAGAVTWIRMGTTVGTNALLERKGASVGLLITEGFGDLLRIGYQHRPDLFALAIPPRPILYHSVAEVAERVIPDAEGFRVERALDEAAVKAALKRFRSEGVESIAVALMHAYGYDLHEKRIRRLAEAAGFTQISLSCEVLPDIRMTDRAQSCVLDAYLSPVVRGYVRGFKSGFNAGIETTPVDFMQSFGGLCPAEAFRGINAVLSGPAGALPGLASLYADRPLIGFDMGGTSTDVCRYDGREDVGFEQHSAGIEYRAPQLRIETVAAGGGSRLFFENGMFRVGPESAGAHPGPVCYRKGGYLSVTDANLILGRIRPEYFPHIFGPGGDEPLDSEATRQAFAELAETINAGRETPMSIETIALAFIRVANDAMATPIKTVSAQRGYNPSEHTLVPFGGAGAQHACAIAAQLGIERVLIHRHAGVFCAYGLSGAERKTRRQRSVRRPLQLLPFEAREQMFISLEEGMKAHRSVRLRYAGSEQSFSVPEQLDLLEAFETEHRRIFGFAGDADVIVEALESTIVEAVPQAERPVLRETEGMLEPLQKVDVYFETGWEPTPVYEEAQLRAGDRIEGPALIMAATSTVVVDPGASAAIDRYGDMHLKVSALSQQLPTKKADASWLPIFANLFADCAEQMGFALQRTAASTNIRERLDFSCALFDASGELIANAPHIPVHLGAMSATVKRMLSLFEGAIDAGDVFVSNAPFEGGSHLPDITVISPYVEAGRVRFITASRGHHADIGGSVPGSMPPHSRRLDEEGAVIRMQKLVTGGRFEIENISEILQRSGARRLEENLADLRAQAAANRRGIDLILQACAQYGGEVVEAYMDHLLRVSAEVLRARLKVLAAEQGTALMASDNMDDGSAVCLELHLDPEHGEAIFDFSGSADQVEGNQNAPAAITHSAVIYALRTLIAEPLPLNGGFLQPIRIRLRKGSLLNPDENAAVVGGNVTTSQRIVDVILYAFGAAANSAGCMNNLTFGNDRFGYYETIGGGAGAVAGFAGASGVHTHMTNTRITDPEILEQRYPVVLERFALRRGSGGKGAFPGGDGLIRRIRFLEKMRVSLLTERRLRSPGGVAGGGDALPGANRLIRGDEVIMLGGKDTIEAEAGDVIEVATPGGGGYGKPET